jgi:hypothetical protein
MPEPCAMCKEPSRRQIRGVGYYCSRACMRKLEAMWKEHKTTLLDEPIALIPDEFDKTAFERYVLKTALHMIRSLPPGEMKRWRKNNPDGLVPEVLAIQIKASALKELPEGYLEREGKDDYKFLKVVPKQVLMDAMVAGRVFKRPPETGDV